MALMLEVIVKTLAFGYLSEFRIYGKSLYKEEKGNVHKKNKGAQCNKTESYNVSRARVVNLYH